MLHVNPHLTLQNAIDMIAVEQVEKVASIFQHNTENQTRYLPQDIQQPG